MNMDLGSTLKQQSNGSKYYILERVDGILGKKIPRNENGYEFVEYYKPKIQSSQETKLKPGKVCKGFVTQYQAKLQEGL